MDSLNGREHPRSLDSERLEALLDKLVALRMDLDPVCVTSTALSQVVVPRELITAVCEILHSAVADVRSIIHQNDGLRDERPARSDGVGLESGSALAK
jgi:hypothetical protein